MQLGQTSSGVVLQENSSPTLVLYGFSRLLPTAPGLALAVCEAVCTCYAVVPDLHVGRSANVCHGYHGPGAQWYVGVFLTSLLLDVHFQYNGFLFGILLLSVTRVMQVGVVKCGRGSTSSPLQV